MQHNGGMYLLAVFGCRQTVSSMAAPSRCCEADAAIRTAYTKATAHKMTTAVNPMGMRFKCCVCTRELSPKAAKQEKLAASVQIADMSSQMARSAVNP